jgi:hypothetical protein
LTRAKKIEEKQDEEVLISEENLNFVVKFAESLAGYGLYGNALTPMLLNSRLRDITLNSQQGTEAGIAAALNSPKDSELVLQAYSEDFEVQSQLYKRLLSYMTTIMAFDLTYECIDAKYEDYSTVKYKRDLDILKKFLDNFDYKKEFQSVVMELLRNEAYFCATRWDKEKLLLQELPASPQYTMITGRWAYGLLFSFNYYWFLVPGVDINLYPPFFKQKFNEIWGDNRNGLPKYQPDLSPQARGASSWVYWQDVDVNSGWCFKFTPTIATRLPYFSALFNELAMQPLMRTLQKNVNMASAAKMILGEVPLLKDVAAKTKDMFAISPSNLGNFLAIVKAAIGDSIKAAAIPLTNAQGVEFTADNSLYKTYLKNTAALSGVNTNLIFTNDQKMNTIETQLSLNVDESLMFSLYPQFEDFMNYQINKLTKNYHFKIHFEGSEFYNNRQQRLDVQMGLMPQGIVLPQKIAASMGMNPFTFQRQLDEARANNFVGNLTPIISAFQQSNKDSAKDTGRPQKDESDLSGEGEQTRADGGNIAKSTSNKV